MVADIDVSVACSACQAKPGMNCRLKNGTVLTNDIHQQRVEHRINAFGRESFPPLPQGTMSSRWYLKPE